ncbi:Receptor-type guanylate cyclase gcy [Seminavis robusta]|uniref:Receptor-type guanylate cyclase gcy n=1 Tax=Seminavis robusta TaxID=568900 RepID=A0A9N8HI86_9STRA|nr:Receptor-type guanylate cyclase gcy [Seminavis robusta]|eukprot:Sro684_g186780.1 Receptor-type guanylate cyclase gcy (1456) ;mRNA; r:24305-30349
MGSFQVAWAVLEEPAQLLHKNPYYQGGCLHRMQEKISVYRNFTAKSRVCNSNDPPEAASMGFCHASPLLDYTEIRIASQSWETNYISAWLLQIILSELLEVPTTLEMGKESSALDFYNPDADFGFGGGDFYYGEVTKAAEVKDCRKLKDEAEYQPCFHMVPEVWWGARFGSTSLRLPGAEPPMELGALGYQSFWVVKFTAQNDSSLVSYLGLQGEENRRKLAETFKRPTTWKQYCQEETTDNCAKPDDTATGPPTNEEEENFFFVPGQYNGYFRYTDKNDCDVNPNCTGFFADFPCGWASFANQQLHHLGIALESDNPLDEAGGFAGMGQIYAAANATKSNLLVYWFDLGILHQSFMGTEFEPTRVVLPEPTQECLDARIDPTKRCGKRDGTSTPEELYGDPAGTCAATTVSLKKVVGTVLYDVAFDPEIPEALWSPAYDVIHNFQISGPQLGAILQWVSRRMEADLYGLTLREATCEWAVENLDLLQSFIPESHPRVVQDEDITDHPLFMIASIFASAAVILVLVCLVVTYVKKNTKVLYYTQPEFMTLFLVGLGLAAIGAIFMVVPPSDASCGTIAWTVNLGYAVHLFPMLVRINAINNLATSGKQMQRVRLKLGHLYAVTFVGVLAVGAYLVAWTLVDPPREAFQYEVTSKDATTGDTIITAYDYCGTPSSTYSLDSAISSSGVWYFVSYAWRALVILPAGMIAFVSLRVREDMNDTRPMSFVLFVHVIVLVIAATLATFGDHRSDLMGYASLLVSIDAILSIAVYIVPKFLHSGDDFDGEPLPDVFVSTTVVLTDIVGFTAWSSVREPVHVFKFLEECYECVDSIADKYKIFKVETVGESWVGASGIPEPRIDHALCAAKFALGCMKKIPRLMKRQEIKFGPDTGDLSLRIGMHSGTVTGGFMKGKGQRFQIFGDASNYAKLMLSTGLGDHIQLSEATANELTKIGKKRWITERDRKLVTEEKGEIQTFFLTRGSLDGDYSTRECGSSFGGSDDEDELLDVSALSDSKQRWIQWNVETFKEMLKDIVARRGLPGGLPGFSGMEAPDFDLRKKGDMPLDEVVEIIELPDFDKKAARRQRETIEMVELSPLVVDQLKEFITGIAEMYNDNPFHNFAHASYVVMAVIKYMNRIKAANEIDVGNDGERFRTCTMVTIHKHTFGVASDPLTLFACVFSALIHDVNHPGVPNQQLMQENEEAGARYKSRSVAEQRSLDQSWDLLMQSRFKLLRSTICGNETELARFRQLVINSVMATDLGDSELKALRNARWEKAFAITASSTDSTTSERSSAKVSVRSSGIQETFDDEVAKGANDSQEDINRKATIVIEHLLQAADVAHMSQHWAIYRKWNERLFRECYKAYREGRAETNPADNWYKGEIGFFDFYIIPLSKKLRDCGVFGPTSDENLNYATNNRNQWEREGVSITENMLKAAEHEYRLSIGMQKQEQSVAHHLGE